MSPEDIAITALDALQPGDALAPRERAQDVLLSYWRTIGELDDILLLPTPYDLDQAFRRARERCGWARG